jgi:hypothetical protein
VTDVVFNQSQERVDGLAPTGIDRRPKNANKRDEADALLSRQRQCVHFADLGIRHEVAWILVLGHLKIRRV